MLRCISLILICFSLNGCVYFSDLSSESEQTNSSNPIELARSLSQRGAHIPAIAVLTKARSQNPFDEQILSELASVYHRAEAFEQSVQIYEGLLEKGAKSCRHLNGAGKSLLRLQQYPKAASYFERCLVSEKNNEMAKSGLAYAANMIGEFSLARTLYLQLINQSPLDLDYRNNYATTLILTGEFQGAVDELASWIHYPQVTAIQRQNLALAFAMLGNWSKVKEMASRDVAPDVLDENMKYYRYLYHSKNKEALRAALLSS